MHIKLNVVSLPEKIIFCRHAESIGNAVKKDDVSTLNSPNHQFHLSPRGHDEVIEVRDFISATFPEGFSEHYVSTFLRTQLTFSGIFLHNIVPFEDPRLDEWWKGIFHSLSAKEINRFYPKENHVMKREGWYHYRPPQGESGKDVELRILSFLSTLNSCKSIFICGHGQWFCFLERILCGKTRIQTEMKSPKNCSVTCFEKDAETFVLNTIFEPTHKYENQNRH